jgi:succinate dehydrogenase/fumarate reductase-like Fe-S protein
MMGAHVVIRYDDTSYTVPAGRTILAALEGAGVEVVRGVGCRGGVCGACTVLYRMGDSHPVMAALMCQEVVQDGMNLLPLPFFPQRAPVYDVTLEEEETPEYRVIQLFPEVNRCIMCGECSRICPVGLDVMGYVGMIKRGDLRGAAQASFTCVQCQACVARCPAQISQPNAALAARLFYGKYRMPRADHLDRMLERIEKPGFKSMMRQLRRMDPDDLLHLYQSREREPEETFPATWLPEDRRFL